MTSCDHGSVTRSETLDLRRRKTRLTLDLVARPRPFAKSCGHGFAGSCGDQVSRRRPRSPSWSRARDVMGSWADPVPRDLSSKFTRAGFGSRARDVMRSWDHDQGESRTRSAWNHDPASTVRGRRPGAANRHRKRDARPWRRSAGGVAVGYADGMTDHGRHGSPRGTSRGRGRTRERLREADARDAFLIGPRATTSTVIGKTNAPPPGADLRGNPIGRDGRPVRGR